MRYHPKIFCDPAPALDKYLLGHVNPMGHLMNFGSRIIFTMLGILCSSDIGLHFDSLTSVQPLVNIFLPNLVISTPSGNLLHAGLAITTSRTTRPSETRTVGLALGYSHTLLLKQDGSVWTTGVNKFGQLGDGSRSASSAFIQVITSGAKAVTAGHSHSIVLKQDGSVWTAGQNNYGQLGDSFSSRSIFVQVLLGEAKAVAAGGYHSLVLMQDGGVWATGWGKHGQLGDASIADGTFRSKFMQVMSSGAKALDAGDTHTIVVKQDGSVWATGGNNNGQLGDGSTLNRRIFVQVMSSGAEAVAAGSCHSMVLKQDGSVWTVGGNRYGQLGDGSITDRSAYLQVLSGFTRAKAVAAGSRHSLVLNRDGSVWATGRNYHGQLGDGSKHDRRMFVQVFVSGAKAFAGGSFHSMLLKQDDSLWASGSNQYGQLGDVSTTSQKLLVSFVRISNGAVHDDVVA